MTEDIDDLLAESKKEMEASIEHLHHELGKLRAGKASPNLVSEMLVSYYGSPTPMGQVANVSAKDSRTLEIKPWEKNMLGEIEKAIFEANLGVTPMNNGEVVLIVMPPMTEDRRKDLVKKAKALGEDAKVSLRSTRHKAMDGLKKAVKDGLPEDFGKRKEDEVEKTVKDFVKKIDEVISVKEKDIMTI